MSGQEARSAAMVVQERESFAFKSALFAYNCPNEDSSLWREMIKGRRINRAAGIASSGEVGLFSLLPTVIKELVLVDHCPGSLRYAVQKYLIVKEYGWGEARRLFTGKANQKELAEALEVIKHKMPSSLEITPKNCLSKIIYPERNKYTYTPPNHISKYWESIPTRNGQKAARKLDKVTFVLGDFRSLDGPFDLFYLSNAWEAGNGNGKTLGIDSVSKLMKPGGLILAATRSNPEGNYAVDSRTPPGLKLVDSRSNRNNLNYMCWYHNVYQVKETA